MKPYSPFPYAAFWLVLILLLPSLGEAKPRRGANYRQPLSSRRLNHLNPVTKRQLDAALREMHRRGLRPHVTSTYRSSAEQRAIYRCAQRRSCRRRRGIYGAKRPGTSLHESGLAVDLGGVARGHRRHRRLTPHGRQVVRIMRRHGFNWRYGLKDPAHFEVAPRRAAYRRQQAALKYAHPRSPRKHRRQA